MHTHTHTLAGRQIYEQIHFIRNEYNRMHTHTRTYSTQYIVHGHHAQQHLANSTIIRSSLSPQFRRFGSTTL